MSSARIVVSLLLVVAVAGCYRRVATVTPLRAPRPRAAEAPADLTLPLRHETLPNGLRVVVGEIPSSTRATVALVCARGGDTGVAARPGLAGATRRVLAQAIADGFGAPPGHAGGVVASVEHWSEGQAAVFMARVTTDDVAPMLWGFASALRRFEARADALAHLNLRATDAASLRPAEVEAHFRASYSPASCTVVVAGSASHGAIMAYAEPLLGPWILPTPSVAVTTTRAARTGGRFVFEQQPGRDEVRVTVTIPVRIAGAREAAAFRVACGLLSPWQSSRLMRVLRHERGDVYHLEGGCHLTGNEGEVRVAGELAPDRAVASLRAIHDIVEALASGASRVTAAEVDLARRQTFSAWRATVESPEAVVAMVVDAVVTGRAPDGTVPAWIDALRTLSPAEVDDFLRRELSTTGASVEVVGAPAAIDPASFEGTGFGPPGRDQARSEAHARPAHREE